MSARRTNRRIIPTVAHRGKKFSDGVAIGTGSVNNIDLMEAIELSHMLDIAEVMCQGALDRPESRRAHYRSDFTKRDGSTWLRHTLVKRDGDNLLMDYKPVTMTRFEPKEHSY